MLAIEFRVHDHACQFGAFYLGFQVHARVVWIEMMHNFHIYSKQFPKLRKLVFLF